MSPAPTSNASDPAHIKAHATGRWAEIIFRALNTGVANRWQFISFRGTAKGEWKGIVDVVAIRKDTSQPRNANLKRGDLFDIVLIQIKGGSALSPTPQDCLRLREVAKYYHASAIVQFQWKKGKSSAFFELNRRTLKWKATTSAAVFQ